MRHGPIGRLAIEEAVAIGQPQAAKRELATKNRSKKAKLPEVRWCAAAYFF
jgi:hypothetical protein